MAWTNPYLRPDKDDLPELQGGISPDEGDASRGSGLITTGDRCRTGHKSGPGGRPLAQRRDVVGMRKVPAPTAYLLGEPGRTAQMPGDMAIAAGAGAVVGEVAPERRCGDRFVRPSRSAAGRRAQ